MLPVPPPSSQPRLIAPFATLHRSGGEGGAVSTAAADTPTLPLAEISGLWLGKLSPALRRATEREAPEAACFTLRGVHAFASFDVQAADELERTALAMDLIWFVSQRTNRVLTVTRPQPTLARTLSPRGSPTGSGATTPLGPQPQLGLGLAAVGLTTFAASGAVVHTASGPASSASTPRASPGGSPLSSARSDTDSTSSEAPFLRQEGATAAAKILLAQMPAPADATFLAVSGETFLKHGRRGSPHARRVFVDFGKGLLSWTSGEFLLRDITAIVPGKATTVLQATGAAVPDELCFAIVTKTRTLDLTATSVTQRDQWVAVFVAAWLAAGAK